MTKKRDKDAALSFVQNALKRLGSPEAITTDGLASFKAAMKVLGNTAKQDIGLGANKPGREQPPAVPTTRAGDASVQANEDAAEVRLGPCQRPLQPGTPPRRSQDLQGTPLGCTGRVEVAHELSPRAQSQTSANRRRVAIRLTAPLLPVVGINCA